MTESTRPKISHSAFLLLGILLTLLIVIGHRFLPERRLTIDSMRDGANIFPVESGNGAPAEFRWIDQVKFHYTCQFPTPSAMQGCGFAYMLASGRTRSWTPARRQSRTRSLNSVSCDGWYSDAVAQPSSPRTM